MSEQRERVLPRHRPGVEVALDDVAAVFPQELILLFAFDAFTDHFQIQALRQRQDVQDAFPGVLVRMDVPHEVLVDGDPVEREILEVKHRGVAGTEVIQPEGVALVFQGVEVSGKFRIVLQEINLRDLQADLLGFQPVSVVGLQKVGDETFMQKLKGREVAGDLDTVALRFLCEGQGLLQNEFSDLEQNFVLREDFEKLRRRPEKIFGVVPPKQGFEADDFVCYVIELGLEI